VFENQLLLSARFKQNGELIETPDSACQLGTIQQVDDYGSFFSADGVQKRILDILGGWLPV